MSLKVITDQYGTIIYRKDKVSKAGNPFVTYSTRVTSKDANGTFTSAFIDVNFKKGVEVQNKTKIHINNAFYVVSEYQEKSYLKLMITDFDVLEEGEQAMNKPNNDDGFMVIDSTDDLPTFFD